MGQYPKGYWLNEFPQHPCKYLVDELPKYIVLALEGRDREFPRANWLNKVDIISKFCV